MEQLIKAIKQAIRKGNDVVIKGTPYGFKVQTLDYKTIYTQQNNTKKPTK